MVESKARALLRELVLQGLPEALPAGLAATELATEARVQGLAALLLAALEREARPWAEPILPALSAERRRLLARTLGQLALAARVTGVLEARGVRALPLKGAVLAESVYDVEAERPMSDVDLVAIDRWPEAIAALRAEGFGELARGDHAWALRESRCGEVVELHRSLVSAPGLFRVDHEGLWTRRRPGRAQLRHRPSAEDLLLALALHAAFQHGLVLSLVQWLDFRRVLERDPPDPARLLDAAREARATAPLAAALLAAEAIVGAPLGALREPLAAALPRGLGTWLRPRLATPLALVLPSEPRLGRVRWELLAGRRSELLWRTLVLPETPSGSRALPARLWHAAARGVRLLPRAGAGDGLPVAHDPDPAAVPAADPAAEVPFAEELLRQCLASFPHVRLTVTGHCMEPALRHGERVHLVSAARRRPRLGDVVLARQGEGLRLHRLVWAPPFGARWRTRADRGLLLDAPLRREDVLASVAVVEGADAGKPRRAARALVSLAGAAVARVRMGARSARAEVS